VKEKHEPKTGESVTLNDYLLIPCLDSRIAYGSRKIYSKFGREKLKRMKRKRLSISTHNK